ncbi:hypothetical protein BHM03_00044515 [Ensete ventricosum]|nr:hypothetical protein BHM03_00044515 [Ensete ventricosum]
MGMWPRSSRDARVGTRTTCSNAEQQLSRLTRGGDERGNHGPEIKEGVPRGAPTAHVPPRFYSGCCRSFVPDDLTAFMTYHATVPSTMLVVLAMRRAFAGGGCRSYLCQVGCTTTGAPRISGRLPASDRPRRRGSCPRV